MYIPATKSISILFAAILMASSAAFADEALKLASVFTDNMVLQRDMKVPVWGWCKPGENVSVSIGKYQANTTASSDGKWIVQVGPLDAGGPYEMTVTCAGATTRLANILAGDVWVCSGQSNMEWPLNLTNDAEKEIAAANYPNIRLYYIPKILGTKPADAVPAKWVECSPQTVPGFSAVGYFFGRDLHKELNVPIGIIEAAWGGSRIEPWTPPCGFAKSPQLKELSDFVNTAEDRYKQAIAAHFVNTEKWLAEAKQAFAEGKPLPPQPGFPGHPLGDWQSPTVMYNGMINAIIPYGIKGAIWYQGESNQGDGMLYCEKMKALIGGWRELWGQGDFPFYYVQIAPLNDFYGPNNLPLLWEAQVAALAIPNTGMAVTTDIANLADIHPRNKQDVGRRLSLWALAKTYGKNIVYSGPMYKSMAVEGNKIRITFDYVGGGLVSRDGKELDWFEIAGEDKIFHKAAAVIDGSTVVVSCDQVAAPVAVRFGWDRAATPNLMNKEGLPASPFRTDKW